MTPVLHIRGVHAGYGETEILHGINISVATGEVVVVIGPNGAGKSTAVKAVLGLLNVTRGDILLHGENGDVAGFFSKSTVVDGAWQAEIIK